MTRPLLLRFVSILGASTSFYLLLSVVPGYATAGGGGGWTAGLATGALMLATVVGELATPALVNRYGYRAVLAVGLGLLGAPALALVFTPNLWWIVTVCLLRGLGFAFTVVAGGALTASLIPARTVECPRSVSSRRPPRNRWLARALDAPTGRVTPPCAPPAR
ncbi:MFS transporter [Kitasatospora aureofaciens]|nr:MFS transporter [Kitasatospora aureofaciens]